MKQITIVGPKRLGLITSITEALAEKNINIESIDAETLADNAVIIVSVDRYDEALQVLSQIADTQAVTEDAILIHLDDEPGALARIARRFTDAGIGIRSMRFIQRNENSALVAVSTERTEEALRLVEDVRVS